MLEIRDLAKSYGDRAVLRGVDLDVSPGQIVGLLGANGAGKSTLISVVAGLRPPDRGSIRIASREAGRARRDGLLGLAPQELGVYPTLTVRQNLTFFARLAGLGPVTARRRALEAAAELDLVDQLSQRAAQLSGGQKRRLHTAVAVLHRPRLLFLDEPTVGADVPSRAGILALVQRLTAEGTAVVYTTHYLTELEQLGSPGSSPGGSRMLGAATVAIAVLHEGRIAVRTSVAELLARYPSLDAAFLAITGTTSEERSHVPIAA